MVHPEPIICPDCEKVAVLRRYNYDPAMDAYVHMYRCLKGHWWFKVFPEDMHYLRNHPGEPVRVYRVFDFERQTTN